MTRQQIDESVLTQEYVKEAMHYCHDTGQLTWKVRPRTHFTCETMQKRWNSRYSGKPAGWVAEGYKRVSINDMQVQAHRLVWLYCYGEWPQTGIDHINHDKEDNRLCNLRLADHAENNRNLAIRADNQSGVNGIYWAKSKNKWAAQINHNKRTIPLGRSKDFFEACCLRKSAERLYGYHTNHGQA